jgi:hypothetical protein
VAIAQLAVEKAAAIAEEGVVSAELVAVVAQGQQRLPGLEASVGRLKIRISHSTGIKAQLLEQGIVAEAQCRAGETGRLRHIPVLRAEPIDGGLEGQAQQGIALAGRS